MQDQKAAADSPWELGAGLLPGQNLLAVQQLIIKGLYRPETEIITIEASPSPLLLMRIPAHQDHRPACLDVLTTNTPCALQPLAAAVATSSSEISLRAACSTDQAGAERRS